MKRSYITKKKTKRLREYDAEFERMKPLVRDRSGGYCESWNFVRDNCGGNTDDYHGLEIASTCEFRNPVHVHHRKYRSRGGTNALSNLIHLCDPCHSWTHSCPKLSNKLGLSLHNYESEEL